jgi:hypothetical protein
MDPLTRRVLALLELNPALDRLSLPLAVLKVNCAWHGPPLSPEQLRDICRRVWLTRQQAGDEHTPDVAFAVPTHREPML